MRSTGCTKCWKYEYNRYVLENVPNASPTPQNAHQRPFFRSVCYLFIEFLVTAILASACLPIFESLDSQTVIDMRMLRLMPHYLDAFAVSNKGKLFFG